jgi:hypothetical protein
VIDAAEFIAKLSGELAPIKPLVERYAADACIDKFSRALCLSRQPKIGEEAFAFRLYPGLDDESINSYESSRCIQIPSLYRAILRKLNGAFLFELALFGIPPMMIEQTGLLSRTTLYPIDLSLTQKNWRKQYKEVPASLFLFGSGTLSRTENIGYFLVEDGTIRAIRKSGEMTWSWRSFSEFLSAELARAEADYSND